MRTSEQIQQSKNILIFSVSYNFKILNWIDCDFMQNFSMVKMLIGLVLCLVAVAYGDEKDDEASNGIVATALVQSATANMKNFKFDEAIAKLEQALQLQPDVVETHFQAAEAYRQNGQKDKAMEHYIFVMDKGKEIPVASVSEMVKKAEKYVNVLDPVGGKLYRLRELYIKQLLILYQAHKEDRIEAELSQIGYLIDSQKTKTDSISNDYSKGWFFVKRDEKGLVEMPAYCNDMQRQEIGMQFTFHGILLIPAGKSIVRVRITPAWGAERYVATVNGANVTQQSDMSILIKSSKGSAEVKWVWNKTDGRIDCQYEWSFSEKGDDWVLIPKEAMIYTGRIQNHYKLTRDRSN